MKQDYKPTLTTIILDIVLIFTSVIILIKDFSKLPMVLLIVSIVAIRYILLFIKSRKDRN